MKKRILSLTLILLLLLTGCNELTAVPTPPASETEPGTTVPSGNPVDVDFEKTDADMFTDRDLETDYDASGAIVIEFNGDSVSTNSNAVNVNGTTVTLTGEATYVLRGTLNNGMVIVNASESDKLQIVLAGASITSSSSAPIYIRQADKVFITLAEGTDNSLSNGGSFTAVDENNIDGALFSKQDLTINGNGALTITSPAGHGIVCKDDLVITGGNHAITSASHGIDANDSVRIGGGTITVDADKDAIHAENADDTTLGFVYISAGTLTLESEGDGISAGAYMQLAGGTFSILTGGGSENASKAHSDSYGDFMGGGPGGPGGMGNPGGRPRSASTTASTETESTSMKGLKAAGGILLSGGVYTIDSADDAIHANGSVTINGGELQIESGDDGIHADETLSITSGIICIGESYEGLEAMDIAISGGDIDLAATDDGLNAAGGTDSSGMGGMRPGGDHFGGTDGSAKGSVVISGGDLYVNASGDGIDANGSLLITGGSTIVVGPTHGDTATLDYDTSGTITGGTFIGTGASGMAQTFSDSEQGVISIGVGTAAAGTEILLTGKDGKTIISYAPELSFGVVILSSPDLVKGESYNITVGEASGEFKAS